MILRWLPVASGYINQIPALFKRIGSRHLNTYIRNAGLHIAATDIGTCHSHGLAMITQSNSSLLSICSNARSLPVYTFGAVMLNLAICFSVLSSGPCCISQMAHNLVSFNGKHIVNVFLTSGSGSDKTKTKFTVVSFRLVSFCLCFW